MLALIRVPREFCCAVRSSLTFLSELQSRRIAVSVLSVKGSARTAKIDCTQKVQYYYRLQLSALLKPATNVPRDIKAIHRTCQSMEEAIETISNIDY